MTREINTSILTAIAKPEVEPFFAVEMMFDTSPLRMWTGLGDLTINGNTYTGVGNLLGFTKAEETSEVAARGMTLTLTAIPAAMRSLALTEPYQGRTCTVSFGIMGSSSVAEIFSGYMDQMTIEHGAETSTIRLSVENHLIDLERARPWRYTSESQKQIYPDDLGFDFVTDLQDKELPWGR